MSVKLGYISENANTLQEVQVVKQDIPRDSFFNAQRSGNGDMQSVIYSEKASIHLESDHLSTEDVNNIRKVLANRQYPHKIFLAHPATNQEYTFDDTVNEVFSSQDNDGLGNGTQTELNASQYTNLNTYNDTGVTVGSTLLNDYSYMHFEADITDFVTAQGVDKISRITLALKDVYLNDGSSTGDIGVGYIVEYYDSSLDAYVECRRQGLTIANTDNIQFASIRPIDNFSNYENALVSNVVKFRIRNLYPNRDNSIRGIGMGIDFAKILVNGYGCVWNNDDNFTYSDTYTGAGWTGNIELLEL